MDVTLSDVAKSVKLDVVLVRDILTEKPGLHIPKEKMDLVFRTARKMKYDFRKLKIGKRMNHMWMLRQGRINMPVPVGSESRPSRPRIRSAVVSAEMTFATRTFPSFIKMRDIFPRILNSVQRFQIQVSRFTFQGLFPRNFLWGRRKII